MMLENSEGTNIIIKSCFSMSIELNINDPLVNKRLIYCQTHIPFIGQRQIYGNKNLHHGQIGLTHNEIAFTLNTAV